jgi:hypothetical protein
MFDTIILLTGHDEYSVFAPRLHECNANLNILPAFNADDLRAITPRQLHRARLIAFTTDVIVPARLWRLQFPSGAPAISGLGTGAFRDL